MSNSEEKLKRRTGISITNLSSKHIKLGHDSSVDKKDTMFSKKSLNRSVFSQIKKNPLEKNENNLEVDLTKPELENQMTDR